MCAIKSATVKLFTCALVVHMQARVQIPLLTRPPILPVLIYSIIHINFFWLLMSCAAQNDTDQVRTFYHNGGSCRWRV
ncbi:hypothetical protein HDV63DRAFT_310175 [Trichoderma sp. SZMC 28014]